MASGGKEEISELIIDNAEPKKSDAASKGEEPATESDTIVDPVKKTDVLLWRIRDFNWDAQASAKIRRLCLENDIEDIQVKMPEEKVPKIVEVGTFPINLDDIKNYHFAIPVPVMTVPRTRVFVKQYFCGVKVKVPNLPLYAYLGHAIRMYVSIATKNPLVSIESLEQFQQEEKVNLEELNSWVAIEIVGLKNIGLIPSFPMQYTNQAEEKFQELVKTYENESSHCLVALSLDTESKHYNPEDSLHYAFGWCFGLSEMMIDHGKRGKHNLLIEELKKLSHETNSIEVKALEKVSNLVKGTREKKYSTALQLMRGWIFDLTGEKPSNLLEMLRATLAAPEHPQCFPMSTTKEDLLKVKLVPISPSDFDEVKLSCSGKFLVEGKHYSFVQEFFRGKTVLSVDKKYICQHGIAVRLSFDIIIKSSSKAKYYDVEMIAAAASREYIECVATVSFVGKKGEDKKFEKFDNKNKEEVMKFYWDAVNNVDLEIEPQLISIMEAPEPVIETDQFLGMCIGIQSSKKKDTPQTVFSDQGAWKSVSEIPPVALGNEEAIQILNSDPDVPAKKKAAAQLHHLKFSKLALKGLFPKSTDTTVYIPLLLFNSDKLDQVRTNANIQREYLEKGSSISPFSHLGMPRSELRDFLTEESIYVMDLNEADSLKTVVPVTVPFSMGEDHTCAKKLLVRQYYHGSVPIPIPKLKLKAKFGYVVRVYLTAIANTTGVDLSAAELISAAVSLGKASAWITAEIIGVKGVHIPPLPPQVDFESVTKIDSIYKEMKEACQKADSDRKETNVHLIGVTGTGAADLDYAFGWCFALSNIAFGHTYDRTASLTIEGNLLENLGNAAKAVKDVYTLLNISKTEKIETRVRNYADMLMRGWCFSTIPIEKSEIKSHEGINQTIPKPPEEDEELTYDIPSIDDLDEVKEFIKMKDVESGTPEKKNHGGAKGVVDANFHYGKKQYIHQYFRGKTVPSKNFKVACRVGIAAKLVVDITMLDASANVSTLPIIAASAAVSKVQCKVSGMIIGVEEGHFHIPLGDLKSPSLVEIISAFTEMKKKIDSPPKKIYPTLISKKKWKSHLTCTDDYLGKCLALYAMKKGYKLEDAKSKIKVVDHGHKVPAQFSPSIEFSLSETYSEYGNPEGSIEAIHHLHHTELRHEGIFDHLFHYIAHSFHWKY